MMELGELEKNHEEFEKRGVHVFAISNDDRPTSQKTQNDFPHLKIVSDANQNLAKEVWMLQPGVGPGGTSTNVPAVIVLNGAGRVRWFYRSPRFIERLSPKQILQAIDEHVES